MPQSASPRRLAVVMGSVSDQATMRHAAATLIRLEIPCETLIVSAHRTPERLYRFARAAAADGFAAIIAGAGGAAHLPGMIAALTPIPVLGVPIEASPLKGVDSLLSIVQMPAGIPVAAFAVGRPGAVNAALFAAAMLAVDDPKLAAGLAAFRQEQTDAVPQRPDDDDPEFSDRGFSSDRGFGPDRGSGKDGGGSSSS